MTSISSAFAAQSFSPLSRLQDELASEVSSGTIDSSDQSALGAALTDIDAEMKSQMQSGAQRPSPGDLQSKIDTLIAGEVSGGKLTSAQADELKKVFANALQHGPGGAGGPPPGDSGAVDGDGDSDSTGSTSTTGTTSASNVLQDFLKLLRDSQGSSSSYGTDGNSLAAQIQSLIVNYQA